MILRRTSRTCWTNNNIHRQSNADGKPEKKVETSDSLSCTPLSEPNNHYKPHPLGQHITLQFNGGGGGGVNLNYQIVSNYYILKAKAATAKPFAHISSIEESIFYIFNQLRDQKNSKKP